MQTSVAAIGAATAPSNFTRALGPRMTPSRRIAIARKEQGLSQADIFTSLTWIIGWTLVKFGMSASSACPCWANTA